MPITDRESAVLESLRAQWLREVERLEKQLDEARANVEALRRVGALPAHGGSSGGSPIKTTLPPQKEPSRSTINPKRGFRDGVRRYLAAMVEEGQHIDSGNCVRWVLQNGVEGEYRKLMNMMPGLLKKEAAKSGSLVQKDPAGGFKKRKSVLTTPLGAAPVSREN